jgi:hypothetical protein
MTTEVVIQSASNNDLRFHAHTKTSELKIWVMDQINSQGSSMYHLTPSEGCILKKKVVDRATKQNTITFLGHINLICMINFMCAKSACLP